jgi:signal peptidase I
MRAWLKDNRGFVLFLIGFAFFRTAVADWNPIPSGSMRPTLLEGDVVLVNRLAYDFKLPLTDVSLARLADPQRGDVVTFSSPRDGTRLIKRIVAGPGDVVEMHGEVLRINGEAATHADARTLREPLGPLVAARALRVSETVAGHSRTVQFLPDLRAARDFAPITLGPDQYFMLGDNRDNSEDSRFIGPVPRRLLIGHAHHIVVSADLLDQWRPRFERVAAAIR